MRYTGKFLLWSWGLPVILSLCSPAARADHYGIPKTGQTISWHPGAGYDLGDDGHLQTGYPVSPPHYIDNENGTVTDRGTNLMWQQSCSGGESFGGYPPIMTWEEAFAYVAAMNQEQYAGYSDWRLPNIHEMLSLIDHGTYCPSINVNYFDDNPHTDYFWTSTTHPWTGYKNRIYVVFFGNGIIGWHEKTEKRWVRAVRGQSGGGESAYGLPKTGQRWYQVYHPADPPYDPGDDGVIQAGYPLTGPRFTDMGDGTVIDNGSGLMWQKDNSYNQPFANYYVMNWEQAFEYVKAMNEQAYAGYRDWRLPNAKELYTLVDHGIFDPCIDPIFLNTQSSYYWSSTTYVFNPEVKYSVAFTFGPLEVKNETQLFYVRAVRGGAPPTTPAPSPTPTPYNFVFQSGDYDGDGDSDIAIFRPSSGLWSVRGMTRVYFGSSSDAPVPGDYSGNGTTDIGIFRGSSGLWAIRDVTRIYYGSPSDTAVPLQWNPSSTCKIGIFRDSSGLWAVRGITRVYFGQVGDIPVPGDYDGNGTNEIGIYRGSGGLWAIRQITRSYFGTTNDRSVPGDYDGNGTWETGIFRGISGLWAIRGVTRIYFGSSADQPVPADYMGDGRDTIGIFRGTSGLWAIRGISRTYFGTSGDIPVTR